jgi:hypothetical protein
MVNGAGPCLDCEFAQSVFLWPTGFQRLDDRLSHPMSATSLIAEFRAAISQRLKYGPT